MENTIEIINPKKSLVNKLKIPTIFFAVLCVVLAILTCCLIKNISSTDLIYEDVTITGVEQESVYVLKSDDAEFRVFVELNEKITSEQFDALVGQTITIARYRNFIYGIESDNLSFDPLVEIETANKDNSFSKKLICCIAFLVVATVIGLFVFYKKAPFISKVHFLEQNYFYNTASQTPVSKKLTKRLLLLLIPLAVLTVLVILTGSKDDNSVKFYTFGSLLIAYLIFLIVYVLFIHSKIVKKKNIEFCTSYFSEQSFDEIYNSYPEDMQFESEMKQDINNPFAITTFEEKGVRISPNQTAIEDFFIAKEMLDKEISHKRNKLLKVDYELFNKHSLSVMNTSFEEKFISYEDLQLKIQCAFYPNGTLSPFVVSSLPNDYMGLKNDLFFLLSPTFYQEIKRKNIKIKGLDYFFKNVQKLINENCNIKTKIVEI